MMSEAINAMFVSMSASGQADEVMIMLAPVSIYSRGTARPLCRVASACGPRFMG